MLGPVVPPVVLLGAVDDEQVGVIAAELTQMRAVSEPQDFPSWVPPRCSGPGQAEVRQRVQ